MFQFIENLKIREIIYRYRDFKREHPDFDEDQLCRLTILGRFMENLYLYNLQNDNNEQIKFYINDLFKQELNLKDVCSWFMQEDYKKYNLLHNSQDINGWRARINNLENRIERLINKISGI